MNKTISLLAAGLALSASAFELNTMPEAQVYEIDTTTGSAYGKAYAVETRPSPRTVTDKSQILPIAHFGSGTLTFTSDGGATETHSFTADGTYAWEPSASGTWTVTTTGGRPGGVASSVFVVSSIAFIEGDGTEETPKTVEDAEALAHVYEEAAGQTGDEPETVYVEVGEKGGDDVALVLSEGDGGEDPVVATIPGGTVIAIEQGGTITVPAGTTITVSTGGGAPVEVAGLASVKPDGTISRSVSEAVAFKLNTMAASQLFALDTATAGSAAFCVETMADENGVRRVKDVSEIFPIAHFGSGTLTFRHEDGGVETHDFTADGTYAWKPSLSGTWTVSTTGGTPGGRTSATFVLSGGSSEVTAVEMTAIRGVGDGGFALAFRPTFKDGATQTPAQWLEAAVAANLVKVVASPTLAGLYTESAKEIDLGDLKASYDEASGAVTFSLTLEQMQTVSPDADAMFFRVEVR